MMFDSAHIINFSQLDKADLELVGKKAYMLGELKYLGIPIPDGFVILPFFHLSENLIREIYHAYKKLSHVFNDASVNIFTSPLNNKPTLFSNVKGDANVISKLRTILTSHLDKPVAIAVAKNIQSKIKGTITTNNSPKELKHISDKIQKHFYFPQEIEYVVEKGKIYITQVRPFTGILDGSPKQTVQIIRTQKALIKGVSVNPGIVTGPVKLINNQNFEDAKNSEIVVAKSLDKSLYNKIKKAKAVVTDTVLQASLDIMLYREIVKVPTIIGAENATKLLQNGNIITVNGTAGEIYSGGFI